MIRAVLFDLDDTLYPEADSMRSAFRAAAGWLSGRAGVDAALAEAVLGRLHAESRDAVYDRALTELGLDVGLAPDLVELHRAHEPTGLRLHDEVPEVLAALRRSVRVGVVTDGWLAVQRRKIDALGVAERVDAVICSDAFGRARWKPHPAPFLACLDALGGISPGDALFVGDNPERDVAGALGAGLRAMLVDRAGAYGFARSEVPPDVPRIRDLRAVVTAVEAAAGAA